ncbi:aminotransferase class V-fold PLP-dependent enzyme [Roseateles violae]|uniref:cysteine desulfurase n=1 Tax=Roseateles violae TaxID=3058042 RepID=A0ABT8DM61_9BURK|nr:aminotransferase class V-fold PLP-dependent enzyme [Pelomonas sp. PFR6]MDN3919008.1 aminotransferase class V-fold PLP-dependent enzyme [Pelomonas sp. PFR6]
MEIYLDANATTPVLAQAAQAALQAMADDFGNPSSVHSTGLKARALMDAVRARAKALLDTGAGQLLFTSGATEGIQTAVLSALNALRGRPGVDCLLYGATEHKAVPEALRHWNQLLGLGFEIKPIPVDGVGRHDLDFLRRHAARAGLVCTMAANNETGVISDLAGIEAALAGSPAFWLVDGVQALGKLPLRLARTRIDYAPFSGHKLYAPKGIGLLYVREGAPVTPLMAGGGQEGALRAGTENMSGIAALGAVLAALDDGRTFRSHAELAQMRARLLAALTEALPGLVLNAPLAGTLPTTLNFAVPGLSSRLLQDLFDAGGVRVSGGSACSAAKAAPSFVLEAMGLPEWQAAGAVRLSIGPATEAALVDEACARIRACGEALRQHSPGDGPWCDDPNALDLSGADAVDCRTVIGAQLEDFLRRQPDLVIVDVREPYEHALPLPALLAAREMQAVPMSCLGTAAPQWLASGRPLLFFCRSGGRSRQAAQTLAGLGHEQSWTLAGGLALLPDPAGHG